MILYQKNLKAILLEILGLSLSVSCSSNTQTLYTTPPDKYEKLGKVTGTATGSHGILSTGYYVIPMGLNSRTQRAYIDALMKAPGATSLTDITYKEDWYWWLIGTARKVTISGEAIREVK